MVGVAPPDHFVDEGAVFTKDVKVARTAQQQRVGKGALEMPVRTFHGAVLVRFAAVVAGRRHGVVRAQRRVTCRGVLALVPLKVAIGCREAIAAVLERRPAEAPQGVLQPLGQGGEALPAQYHVRVGEAGIGQAEVIQKVLDPRAGNPHPQATGVGEIRQPELTRRMSLAEYDLPLRSVHRAPLANATLQRPANAGTEFRMAPHQLLEQRHRANVRRVLQQRHDLLVEDPRQRVRPASPPRLLLGGGKSRIGLDPVGRGGADPGLRRSRLQRIVLSK